MSPTLLEKGREIQMGSPQPKRFNIYRLEDVVSAEIYKVCVGNQMVLQNLYNNRQDCYNLLRIVSSSVSLREMGN